MTLHQEAEMWNWYCCTMPFLFGSPPACTFVIQCCPRCDSERLQVKLQVESGIDLEVFAGRLHRWLPFDLQEAPWCRISDSQGCLANSDADMPACLGSPAASPTNTACNWTKASGASPGPAEDMSPECTSLAPLTDRSYNIIMGMNDLEGGVR